HVSERVLMPPSPLTLQVLFIGGHDMVQTTKTYNNPAGRQIAKENHDFIGFTPDNTGESLGWVSVNHEMIYRDDKIGDGGGMTVFRVERDDITGLLNVVSQRLDDGRRGEYFNVDFVNTVGETGMNCGGISSTFDGRIWTAEEWFRTSNASVIGGSQRAGAGRNAPVIPDNSSRANQGVRDTSDFTVLTEDFPEWDGLTIEKYQNFNYMVEIDPKQAVALRKQYNWGRMGWEGGSVANDNKTVYLGPDATPGFWIKFEADKAADFTSGKLYCYKHDDPNYWIELDNTDPANLLELQSAAIAAGGTMYNRIEWVAHDKKTDLIYWTETGRDFPGSRWADENAAGAVHDPAHIARAAAQGVSSPNDPNYRDTYGRVWVYNPVTNQNSVLIEGGPDWNESISPSEDEYFDKHLTNPDGLSVMDIDGQSFLVIQEDLNGTSYGRMPAGISNRTCELFLLNLAIENPTIDDLIRITAVPAGAEITGAVATPDGKSLLVNSQHPSSNNPFPWNHSLTFALHGFDRLTVEALSDDMESVAIADGKKSKYKAFQESETFSIFPNPTTRAIILNQASDVAIYDVRGQRVMVARDTEKVDVSALSPGAYFVQNEGGEMVQLVIE
ncbi:MAG: alkaline phosphatase PhoX, partial [Bacteroidota bacterium]